MSRIMAVSSAVLLVFLPVTPPHSFVCRPRSSSRKKPQPARPCWKEPSVKRFAHGVRSSQQQALSYVTSSGIGYGLSFFQFSNDSWNGSLMSKRINSQYSAKKGLSFRTLQGMVRLYIHESFLKQHESSYNWRHDGQIQRKWF